MISRLTSIEALIGNTPLRKLDCDTMHLYAKLEYNNFSGSIKDRAAYNILLEAIRDGLVYENTEIIESSSGNFAIALGSLCRVLKLKFIAVIDPNINALYEKQIRLLTDHVIKVETVDHTGGYLLSRIDRVKEICNSKDNIFWTNQYENENNYLAYYKGMGAEICSSFSALDYLFVAVSSCGTITGLSRKVKEKFPKITIVAVDIEGSVIFGAPAKKRHVSGIGASKTPLILKEAVIDEIVHVSEVNIVRGATRLLRDHNIFSGASAGASYWAVSNFFKDDCDPSRSVLFLCPDRGHGYIDTVYDHAWATKIDLLSL